MQKTIWKTILLQRAEKVHPPDSETRRASSTELERGRFKFCINRLRGTQTLSNCCQCNTHSDLLLMVESNNSDDMMTVYMVCDTYRTCEWQRDTKETLP